MTPKARRLTPGVNTEVARPTCGPEPSSPEATWRSVRPSVAGKSATVEAVASLSCARSVAELGLPGRTGSSDPPPQPANVTAAAVAAASRRRDISPRVVDGRARAHRSAADRAGVVTSRRDLHARSGAGTMAGPAGCVVTVGGDYCTVLGTQIA